MFENVVCCLFEIFCFKNVKYFVWIFLFKRNIYLVLFSNWIFSYWKMFILCALLKNNSRFAPFSATQKAGLRWTGEKIYKVAISAATDMTYVVDGLENDKGVSTMGQVLQRGRLQQVDFGGNLEDDFNLLRNYSENKLIRVWVC